VTYRFYPPHNGRCSLVRDELIQQILLCPGKELQTRYDCVVRMTSGHAPELSILASTMGHEHCKFAEDKGRVFRTSLHSKIGGVSLWKLYGLAETLFHASVCIMPLLKES
jgi:hypothetical protein